MSSSDELAAKITIASMSKRASAVESHIRLEELPKWINLLPMIAQWLWLSLKYWSLTLPAAANPSITAGGLAGEGKSEYFGLMGSTAMSRTAAFSIFNNVDSDHALKDAEQMMLEAGLDYPLIAKPDIGWCGYGVRLIRNPDELAAYLRKFPKKENIVLQRFVSFEGEAGLYYARWPGHPRGRLTGVLLRSFPSVVGDGISTIAELMRQHKRARRLGRDGRSEACCDTSRVPCLAEIVRLSITGSTRVGGMYEDGTALVTPELENAVNAVALDMTDIHIARFDVRYESLGSLQNGEFQIIEVNGVGAEAVHAWDPRYSLAEAYRIVFDKQRKIFEVGAAMRKRGYRPLAVMTMFRLLLRQLSLIRRYPPSN